MEYTIQLSDNLVITDNIRTYPLMKFLDGLFITDEKKTNAKSTLFFQDNISISENSNLDSSILMVFSDYLSINDNATINAELTEKFTDNVLVKDYIDVLKEINGVATEETEYDSFCMNIKLQAFSRYKGFSFNSAVKHKGKYIIANGNGLFENIGDMDNEKSINASFKTGLIRFGGNLKARVDKMFLAIKNDGQMNIKVIGSDGLEKYYSLTKTSDRLQEKQVVFGKGNGNGGSRKCTYFQFEIDNSCGSNFELDNIAIYKLVQSTIS